MIRALAALSVVLFVGQACANIERSPRPEARNAAGPTVCNDPAIEGVVVPKIEGRIAQCGIENPVRITAVAGVQLSQAATVDCNTARALRGWVSDAAVPEFSDRGGLAQLEVAAHYVCRTRNHRPGAKISEHGKGRAIDISGFTLRTGETVTLLNGWNSKDGKRLRALWRAACGPFGTVLGPESDRFHKDHFHFDTAQYRSGSYCR
ncbi:extensin family protein [Nereida sp. MMG025]|uniref:extensin-like domain-containing protein n=1 Tax=Nereida sp. MMG025 TaxID=2909981 RepID=UPI001F3C4D32|nr:extensin family protein [Nereida sp. MMG025]MCF6444121.1 extensin family protein [Nereida sp. MMG025]